MKAEEFLKDLQFEYEETGEYKMYFAIDIPNKLIEFAQYHVKKALEAAAKKAKIYIDTKSDGYEIWDVEIVDEDSILNAYPESNIV